MIKKVLKRLKKKIKIRGIAREKGAIIKTSNIGENVRVGKSCLICKGVKIESNVNIGDYTYINLDTTVDSNVNIGKYCSISKNVFIAPGTHEYKYVTTHPILFNPFWRKKMNILEKNEYIKKIGREDSITNIGNDVLIGLNSIVMRGVTIGDGAIVGAGAVVTKDVEPYSIVAGNPAHHIKYRFESSYLEKLKNMKKKWCDYSPEELEEKFEDMYNIVNFIEKNEKEGNSI